MGRKPVVTFPLEKGRVGRSGGRQGRPRPFPGGRNLDRRHRRPGGAPQLLEQRIDAEDSRRGLARRGLGLRRSAARRRPKRPQTRKQRVERRGARREAFSGVTADDFLGDVRFVALPA
jgi:hypothetical protein